MSNSLKSKNDSNPKIFKYPILIKETNLDVYGHVNNAVYMTLFEEARWDLLNTNGYGLKNILESGLGPIILEANLKFSKELRLHDQIVIETYMQAYQKKIATMIQKMVRDGKICCTAEFTIGLFNLKERKLVLPTEEWLKAIGFCIV